MKIKNSVNWVLTKPLKNLDLVNEFENKYQIKFPESYKSIVKENNFGRPRPNIFDTEKSEERIAKCLLSFELEHKENIWDMYFMLKKQLPSDVIPFMVDQFGNFICFYFDVLLEEANIVFWNVETMKIEKIAETFEEFIKKLYELEGY